MFGKHSENKKIPNTLYTMNDICKNAFLDTYIYGDGNIQHYKTVSNPRTTTTSERLAAGLCMLYSLLNKDYCIDYKEPANENQNEAYDVKIVSFYGSHDTKKRSYQENYDGYVYDLTVQDTENFAIGIGNVVVHNTHVDRSINNNRIFIQSNIVGTHSVLETCRQQNIPIIQTGCYDEKTRAVTKTGLKYYSQLKIGDEVLTLNQKRIIEWKSIKKIVEQDYNGPMYHFIGRSTDLLVTSNHRMYIRENNNLLVESAAIAAMRPKLELPSGKHLGIIDEKIHIENFGTILLTDFLYLLGIYIGDGFSDISRREIQTKTGLNKQDYMTKCLDKSGRFVSSLKIGNHNTCISYSYRIFIDIPENDPCRHRVEETLTRIGINWYAEKGKAGEHIYFTSKELYPILKQCGNNVYSKHIPEWIFKYDSSLLYYLYEGLMVQMDIGENRSQHHRTN